MLLLLVLEDVVVDSVGEKVFIPVGFEVLLLLLLVLELVVVDTVGEPVTIDGEREDLLGESV